MFITAFIHLFSVKLRLKLKDFTLAKQALYHFNHTSSPFCSGYFGDGGLVNYLPRLASNYCPPNPSLPSS
jgi:hypothetical protein